MPSRPRTYNNSQNTGTSNLSNAPAQGIFQSLPFVMQPQATQKSQEQPDLKVSLMRAERYGHHLGQIQAANVSVPTAVQPQSDGMIQQPNLTTSLRQTERYGHNLSKTDIANQSERKAVQPKLENKPVQLAVKKRKNQWWKKLWPKTNLLSRKKYTIKAQGNTIPGGTNTNQSVRTYANAKTTKIPKGYTDNMSYLSDNGKTKTRTFIGHNPHRPNQNPNRKTDWDAGHIQGNQIGGSGTNKDNIFPQNPIANQQAGPAGRQYTAPGSHKWHNPKNYTAGIKHKGQPMAWREWEDKKGRKARKYGKTNVTFSSYG